MVYICLIITRLIIWIMPCHVFSERLNTGFNINAGVGSGGVGFLVRFTLFEDFNISVLDDTKDDILWIKLGLQAKKIIIRMDMVHCLAISCYVLTCVCAKWKI